MLNQVRKQVEPKISQSSVKKAQKQLRKELKDAMQQRNKEQTAKKAVERRAADAETKLKEYEDAEHRRVEKVKSEGCSLLKGSCA